MGLVSAISIGKPAAATGGVAMVKWCHGIGLVSAISVGKPAAATGGLAMVKWCHGMGLVSAIMGCRTALPDLVSVGVTITNSSVTIKVRRTTDFVIIFSLSVFCEFAARPRGSDSNRPAHS